MIALDVHVIGERETGNETYMLNLVRGLLTVAPDRCFALLTPHPERLPEDVRRAANARVMQIRPANSFVRVPFSLPYMAWSARASLLHVTYVLPPLCPCPGVATVHDLSYLIFPHDAPPRDRLVLRPLLPLSVRRAAAVIVISESTRRDVINRLGVPDARITVTPLAAPPHIRMVTASSVMDRVRSMYGLSQEYILAVGNLQPRKNLGRLIEAFSIIRREGHDAQLVIVGQARWRQSEILRTVKERGLDNDVVFTGYVADADLSALYSGAAVFVYPSLYEGFGLPILEAMACGAPVVTSNTSSLPEVAGDAALLVDPRSVPALTDAIRAVLLDSQRANELRARGFAQVARFSWSKTAQQTLAVYDRVLKRSRRGW